MEQYKEVFEFLVKLHGATPTVTEVLSFIQLAATINQGKL